MHGGRDRLAEECAVVLRDETRIGDDDDAPVGLRADEPPEALAEAALADKKRSGGDITLVIPKKIGVCELKKVSVTDLLPIIRAGLEG